jgi:rhodanese-related sulfurtransferase
VKFPAITASLFALLLMVGPFFAAEAVAAEPVSLESYVREFDYESRKMMKCSGKELLSMLIKKQAVLVDIRFPEEQQAWGPSFALKIPLNELPARLNELPKDKVIVTACPHIDRSSIAMVYLTTKGYNACYLVGGLVGLAELLRGDEARDFMASLNGVAASQGKPKPSRP